MHRLLTSTATGYRAKTLAGGLDSSDAVEDVEDEEAFEAVSEPADPPLTHEDS